MDKLKETIRNIPDFPIDGILFRDITTLLKNRSAFREAIDKMTDMVKEVPVDTILGIESRGFIFASPIAYNLGIPMNLIRKPGKLPADKESATYELEYGENTIEIHKDAVSEGDNIVICDDLLATGGTAEASAKLVEKLNGNVSLILFLIELTDLNGKDKLRDYKVESIIKF